MKLLLLAARNLARNLRRTLITGAAVAVGLTMMIAMVTLQTGSYDLMVRKAISQLAGHVVVQGRGYQESRESEVVVENAGEVAEAMRRAFPDAVVAPRILLQGLLVSATASTGVGLNGVDPEAEALLQDLDEQVEEGDWLASDDDQGILIGAPMARSLEVGIGDKVVYMGQHGGDEMASRLFRVRGIFRSGAAEIDGFMAIAPLSAAQELLGRGDVANMVTVHLTDPDQSEDAAIRARALVGQEDREVLPWSRALPQLNAMIRLDRNTGDVMMGILGIIVAMGVLNTVLMSVLERTREFGVMFALGMRPRQVATLVLLEGAVLGACGAVLGLVLGLLASWPLVTHGIDYSSFAGGGESMEMAGIVMDSVMKGKLNPWRTAVYTVATVAFTTLACLYPALYVARLKPVEAIHHT